MSVNVGLLFICFTDDDLNEVESALNVIDVFNELFIIILKK